MIWHRLASSSSSSSWPSSPHCHPFISFEIGYYIIFWFNFISVVCSPCTMARLPLEVIMFAAFGSWFLRGASLRWRTLQRLATARSATHGDIIFWITPKTITILVIIPLIISKGLMTIIAILFLIIVILISLSLLFGLRFGLWLSFGTWSLLIGGIIWTPNARWQGMLECSSQRQAHGKSIIQFGYHV